MVTATAEHYVATHEQESRPLTSSSAPRTDLANLIPDLLSAIEAEGEQPEDLLQAETCLAWIHWTLGEPGLAASRLPKDYRASWQELSQSSEPLSSWDPSKHKTSLSAYTEVCLVKGACLKGMAQKHLSSSREAYNTFQSLLPWVAAIATRPIANDSPKVLQPWCQQYLAQFALLLANGPSLATSQESQALRVFRLWAEQETKRETALIDESTAIPFVSTNEAWKAYFVFLSQLLEQDYHYPDDATKAGLTPRLQQYAELLRVQSTWENVLLKTIRFPKADDSNQQIEEWITQVMNNWTILSGPDWSDRNIQGGKDAASRSVLDILYRAATKTFHSTMVLRFLFRVHKTLAEFELAYKALDSYIIFVKRGRAKAAKAEIPTTAIEDHETAIYTLSEGIEGLCGFGSAVQAEKADQLAALMQEWAEVSTDDTNLLTNGTGSDTSDENHQAMAKAGPNLSLEATAIAYRAIGIGKAQWARYTPFSEDRSSIQKEAIANLKKSITTKTSSVANYEAFFALGLLLAETRDFSGAIQCVKEALSSPEIGATMDEAPMFARERKLVPLWHLLSLVLSSRSDFLTAQKACEGALEQFPSPHVIFGRSRQKHLDDQSSSLDEKDSISSFPTVFGLIDSMSSVELERIIEIRMTEIVLTEVVEGAEVALNTADELLELFVRLFGKLGIEVEGNTATKSELIPPKSSAGTVRSFRSSIFSRKKTPRASVRKSSLVRKQSTIEENDLERFPTAATAAPTIQVTDEDQGARVLGRQHSHRLQRREGSINRKLRERSQERAASRPASSYVSSRRQSFETGREGPSRNASIHGDAQESDVAGQKLNGYAAPSQVANTLPPAVPPTSGVSQSSTAKQNLPEIPHNYKHDGVPPPPGHKLQPPEQDIRLPTRPSTPVIQAPPQFPDIQARRHAFGILVKIWLLIAGLYRRATIFDDSREACEEAYRQFEAFEALVATQESSARAFATSGWGNVKSSDDLMADVLAEKGFLALARELPHEAIEHFEGALDVSPHHGKATVGLSNILLDIYNQKIPLNKPQPGLDASLPPSPAPQPTNKPPSRPPPTITFKGTSSTMKSDFSTTGNISTSGSGPTAQSTDPSSEDSTPHSLRKTPSNLFRLAARDRAYGLLSAYTKLGSGWDDSEAWFALARAYEESGQVEKAREVLWWCVELEDGRPVRRWSNVGSSGYVL